MLLAQTLVHIPKIVHEHVNYQGHPSQHQRDRSGLPSCEESCPAADLQHDGDRQQHGYEWNPVSRHVLRSTLKSHNLSDAGDQKIQAEQDATGDANKRLYGLKYSIYGSSPLLPAGAVKDANRFGLAPAQNRCVDAVFFKLA